MKNGYSLDEYLLWRGDLTFSAAPFCEIDGLIFATLVYLDFRGLNGENILPFRYAGIALRPEQLLERNGMIVKSDVHAFAEKMYRCDRFNSVLLTGFVSRTDPDTELQFAAVTILLPGGDAVIVFRGTDESLVGWKEDCNMSFLSTIPAQDEAMRYLDRAADVCTGKLYVCGHSKGGNLAVYAAVSAGPEVRKRIARVFSYDGPGFGETFLTSDAFVEMQNRIVTFIPESSVVGALFRQGGEVKYVKSREKGVMQHVPLSWLVAGNHLAYANGRSEFGKRADDVIRNGLDVMQPDERKEFVEILFQILKATDADTIDQLTGTGISSVLTIRRTFASLEKEKRKRFLNLFLRLTSLQREPNITGHPSKKTVKQKDGTVPGVPENVLPERNK